MADVKVSLIKTDSSQYDITKSNGLKSIKSVSQLTVNPTKIKFGILKNSGDITIIDENNEFLKKIMNNEIDPNKTSLFVKVNGNDVQKHNIIPNDYNHESNTLKILLSNGMEELKNIKYNSYRLANITTMYELLKDCLTTCGYTTNQIDASLSENILYGDNYIYYDTIKKYLQSITIKYINFPDISASDLITKICESCQLVFVEDDNGNKKFYSLRPIERQNANYISIPSDKQQTILSYNLITDNKYDAVELQEYGFVREEVEFGDTPLSDVTENSKFIYINTVIMDRNNTSTIPSDYSFETYGNWLIITFTANGLKNKRQASITADNYQYVLKWSTSSDKTEISDIENSVGDELAYYSSLADFKTWLSGLSSSTYHSAGIKDEFINPNTDTFNQPMTYFLALKPDNGDVMIRDFAFLIGGDAEFKYLEKQLTTTIYGNSSSTKKIGMDNSFFIDENYFQNDQEQNTRQKLSQVFANNILYDYQSGIRSAKVSIFCGDFYDNNDSLAKNWAQGQIIQNADILKFEHQDSFDTYIGIDKWKVTGRTFNYKGSPYIDLELQEVKFI